MSRNHFGRLLLNPQAGLAAQRRGAAGVPTFNFDPAEAAFTPAMAKRTGPGPFAAAPIVQGSGDGSGGDVLSASRGSQIDGHFYANFDGNQWMLGCHWTPQRDAADGSGKDYLFYASASHYVAYDYDNTRFELAVGGQTMTASYTTVAGATVALVAGGSSVTAIDGTNYGRISINDAHTYGITTQPTASAPDASLYIGSNNGANAIDGVIEGAFVVREMLWDGTYGTDLGTGDAVAAHYASGSGADVTATIGAFDVTFCMPTDASVGELGGTGQAWSFPHSSNLITPADAHMLDATAWNNWTAEGSPINPALLAAAEKVYQGGYQFEATAAGDGYYKDVAVNPGDDWVIRVLAHSVDGVGQPKAILYDATNGAEIGSLEGTTGSTAGAPDELLFTGEAPYVSRYGVAADCTTLRVKLVNAKSSGVVAFHQVQLQENLIDNPSMEVGSGDPWIPGGWANSTLEAGDSVQETSDTHSGQSAFRIQADENYEGYRQTNIPVNEKFYSFGGWRKSISGNLNFWLSSTAYRQSTAIGVVNDLSGLTVWHHSPFVVRENPAYSAISVHNRVDTSGYTGLFDDVYLVALDPVTLTVIPADLAASTEGDFIRVDGRDTLTQAPAGLSAASWVIRFEAKPLNAAADVADFGISNPALWHWYEDASNYAGLDWNAANTLRLTANGGGAGDVTDTADMTGAWDAGTAKTVKVQYDGTDLKVYLDGIEQLSVAVAFASEPTTPNYFGSDKDGANQADVLIAAPA